jgi:hypothetical protein
VYTRLMPLGVAVGVDNSGFDGSCRELGIG